MPEMDIQYILLVVGTLINITVLFTVILILGRRRPIDFTPILTKFDQIESANTRLETTVGQRFSDYRSEQNAFSTSLRSELQESFLRFGNSTDERMTNIAGLQKNQLETFSQTLNNSLGTTALKIQSFNETLDRQQEALKNKLDTKLTELRNENSRKLDEIRVTVDEKLQTALERRLGEAFKQVSERLEKVHAGLGEMQNLASGVGDLKRVLTNVKTRGTWGEHVLGDLLGDMLTPEQFGKNVSTNPNSSENVEFAVKLPGNRDRDTPLYLPIDSKFPKEDYERIVQASEIGDLATLTAAEKQLGNAIKKYAKDISSKYIHPPFTTDFAIMFLPTEGLYAEVLRKPGLVDAIQRESRVVIAGPTTFSAMLRSLQMGFKTLAIEKRSSEVWEMLSGVKLEFGKFGEVLVKVKKKLQEASNQMDQVDVRTRQINRKLRNVDQVPEQQTTEFIGLAWNDEDTDEEFPEDTESSETNDDSDEGVR